MKSQPSTVTKTTSKAQSAPKTSITLKKPPPQSAKLLTVPGHQPQQQQQQQQQRSKSQTNGTVTQQQPNKSLNTPQPATTRTSQTKINQQQSSALIGNSKTPTVQSASQKSQKLSYSSAVANKYAGKTQTLADLDDFEPVVTVTRPTRANNGANKQQQQPTVSHHRQSSSSVKMPAKTSEVQQHSLADLDDFDAQPLTGKASKSFNAPHSVHQQQYAHRQRIVVPHDKFARVMGRNNCNVKTIQELTGAVLELEDKKIPPNQDRSILIGGDSVDVTKYAYELLQALINGSDNDLLNLLPAKNNPTNSNSNNWTRIARSDEVKQTWVINSF